MKCPKCRADNSETQRFCGECGASLEPAPGGGTGRPGAASGFPSAPPEDFTKTLATPAWDLAPGSVFAGRYRIVDLLGRGGMGTVYRAFDTALNEEVALKLVRPEVASDQKTLERFRNELRLARKISHRHVGRMYELLEHGGAYFITMEYVPGEDLRSLIKRVRQLAPATAVLIAREAAEGLAEAHRLGIIHRDLKPSNIMFDKDGNAKIMDFGIARGGRGRDLTGEGVIIGTPEYMSPEQVEGRATDQRSDIYSLGVILFEMLTGRAPFEGETAFSLALKHKSETPPDPRKLNPQIQPGLSQLVLRCLEKDPAKRFQNAEELLAGLAGIEEDLPTTARAAPPRKPLTSREITVKFGVKKAGLGLLILVAAAALGVILWRALGGRKGLAIPGGPPSLAVMLFNNNTGDSGLEYWRNMLADALTADLTQSRYIEVLSRERLVQVLQDLGALDDRVYSAETLRQVAARGRVNHLLVGDYAKAGEVIRIHVALQNAGTGRTVASESAEGKGADSIFGMIDELSRKIKADLNLSRQQIDNDADKDVGEITTKNLEAYKYYLEGIRYHDQSENRESIALYEKALSLDPEFVMAYRALAIAYYNLGLTEMARKYQEKALEFKNRFSQRERYQLAGDIAYNSERTFPQAIENYSKLLELYPQSRSAGQELGNIYYAIEDWGEAISYYEMCLRNKSTFIGSYEYLASAYRAKGMSDKAFEALQAYLKNVGDNAFIHFDLAHHFLCLGQYEAASGEMDRAMSLNPTHMYNAYYRGVTALFLEKWDAAGKQFRALLEEREPEGWYRGTYGTLALLLTRGRAADAQKFMKDEVAASVQGGVRWAESEMHGLAAYAALVGGAPVEAVKEAEAARTCAMAADRPELERAALHCRGIALAAMKSFAEARKTAEEIKAKVESSLYKKDIRRYEHLMGLIAFGEGRIEEAVSRLDRAASELPSQCSFYTEDHHLQDALYLEPLADSYVAAGNLTRARETYEKITRLTAGRFLYGDKYARAFYRLGVIAEKQGQKGEAVARFRKFLDLWSNADIAPSERAEAGKKVAALGE
jgi:serine/threonine protein kinase/tetratricopeptide (TPR) repeat protein